MRSIRRLLFAIAPAEATFRRRGFFEGRAIVRAHLERIGRVFLDGYHAALECPNLDALSAGLDAVEPAFRGFAYEGAGMALALLDRVSPRRGDAFARFLAGGGARHAYMVHVGAGWAWARLGTRVDRAREGMDPLLGWLAVDGYGFHEGYFRPSRSARRDRGRAGLRGYAPRAFDQGLGRSLWFRWCGDATRIASAIAEFPPARAADLWSGAGLACAYACGVGAEEVEALRGLSGPNRARLAQGAAFAATARHRAGCPSEATEAACAVLCGRSCEELAVLVDDAARGLPGSGPLPDYEVWRGRVASALAREGSVSP